MDANLEEELTEALGAVYMHFGEWSYADLVAGFQAVEHKFASKLSDADSIAVKRSVVEATIRAAQDTEQPVEHCLDLVRRLDQLGWSSRLPRANLLYAFCRYCLDHGRKDVGLSILGPIVAEIEQDQVNQRGDGFASWLKGMRELLAELKD